MASPEGPDDREPKLPHGVSAAHILDEFSGKQIAELAAGAGMTREAYERFLQKRARNERVAKTVAEVQGQLASGTEKTPYDKQAEEAVMQGIRQMREQIRRPDITENEEERYYSRAYVALSAMEANARDARLVAKFRQDAILDFDYAIRARAIRELFEQVQKGVPYSEAKAIVVDSFNENAKKQNIPELGQAYANQAKYIEYTIDAQRPWATIDPLIEHYGTDKMTQDDKDLLENLIACAKATYFKGKFDHKMSERFNLKGFRLDYIDLVIKAYRKFGPHKTTADKVAGPTEVYGSIQSGDRNFGYNRTGKRRPHRGTPDDERF